MRLPIISHETISDPLLNYAYAFIDINDKKLKIKTKDRIIEFSSTDENYNFNILDLIDYTSFEIFAHNYNISSGSSILGQDVYNDESLLVSKNIAAQMTETFGIETSTYYGDSDIIIDWGDGSILNLSDSQNLFLLENNSLINPENQYKNTYNYVCKHTYQQSGKYCIKIYGKKYFSIKHFNNSEIGESLLCNCFSDSLPIANHITNLDSFAINSPRLLSIQFSKNSSIFNRIINWENCFSNCVNLLQISNFSLTNVENLNGIFNNCNNLNIDINTMFSNFDKIIGEFNVSNLFSNCEMMSGQIDSNKLWNNKNIIWKNFQSAFIGCSDNITSLVPACWGGNAHDSIIKTDFFTIIKPTSEMILYPKIIISASKNFNNPIIINPSSIENDNLYFDIFTGSEWMTMPSNGLASPFDDMEILVNVSKGRTMFGNNFYVKYCWIDENGYESNYRSLFFPSQFSGKTGN